MTSTDNTLGLTLPLEATTPTEIDPAILRNEFNEIIRAADAGEFTYKGDPNEPDFLSKKAAFNELVRVKVKRGIELQAILRRQNSGPAKPKAAAKGRGKKKGGVDTAAIMAGLLD